MPGPLNSSLPESLPPRHALTRIEGRFHMETLSGAVALDATYPALIRLDPNGAHRDVTLEAEETSAGLYRRIVNGAGTAHNLVVKDDGGATIATINQNEQGEFYCTGSAWVLVCVTVIELS